MLALGVTEPAGASWGSFGECKQAEASHCYSLVEHNVTALASIVFVSSYVMTVPEWSTGAFSSQEQWISFNSNPGDWIETGTIGGSWGGDCCSLHAFYAERDPAGNFKITVGGTVPVAQYNHYVLYDAEHNGRWHIYWGCCEVGYYGGGWPEKFTQQEAGVEATSATEPRSWMRQEVAWSQGGEWFAWTGAKWFASPGLCISTNPDSSAAGNVQAGTKLGGKDVGVSC